MARQQMRRGLRLRDGDYILVDGRAWVEVGPFAVRIVKTDEGVLVDVYANGHETAESLTSCWAMDADAAEVASREEVV